MTFDALPGWLKASNPGIRSSKKFYSTSAFCNYQYSFHSTGNNLSHGTLEIQVWVALNFIHILGVQDDQRSWCSYELKDIQALLDISTGSFAGH